MWPVVFAFVTSRFRTSKSFQSKCNMFALAWIGIKVIEYLRNVDEASLLLWESRLETCGQVVLGYTVLTLVTGYNVLPHAVTKIGLAVTAYVILAPTLLHLLHRRSPVTGDEAELIASRFFWLEIPVEAYFCMSIVRFLDSRVRGGRVWAKLWRLLVKVGRPIALASLGYHELRSIARLARTYVHTAWFTAPAHEFYKQRLTRSFLNCDCVPGPHGTIKELTRGPMLISNACLNDFEGQPGGMRLKHRLWNWAV